LARNRHRRTRLARWLPLDVLDAARPASDPRPPGTETEVGQRVGAALGALPSPQREACSLRLLGELTLEEIAAVTGASLGTVKSRLFYGQRRLRELLADMNPRGGATCGGCSISIRAARRRASAPRSPPGSPIERAFAWRAPRRITSAGISRSARTVARRWPRSSWCGGRRAACDPTCGAG